MAGNTFELDFFYLGGHALVEGNAGQSFFFRNADFEKVIFALTLLYASSTLNLSEGLKLRSLTSVLDALGEEILSVFFDIVFHSFHG